MVRIGNNDLNNRRLIEYAIAFLELTRSDWGRTINQHCKMWIRTRLFGLLHYALYDFDHGLNETIGLRIPWARVLHFESVLQGKFLEFLGHELGSLICVHRCWYPVLWKYCLEKTYYVSRRLTGQFLYERELVEVVGNQQVVVRTMPKYVNFKFEPWQAGHIMRY